MNAVRWFPRRRGREPHPIARWALAGLLVLGSASGAMAAIPDSAGMQVTPPRLGLLDGEVLFWRPGAGDWEAAQQNLPLAAGDALATRDGKLELQVGAKSFIRAGNGTELRLQSNEPEFVQFEVSSGHVTADVRELPRGDAVEIDTANAAVRIARDGFYRIDVDGDATQVAVRRGGEAEVVPAGGSSAVVATGEAVEVRGSRAATITAMAAPAFDDWDRWNYDRADRYLAARRSYAVSDAVYGGPELEEYGNWRYVNTYGRVWVPYSVPAGWAPYTYGRWVADPLYGWSWVDYAPWGWAPYHYGRWVYAGYWAWSPGPVLAVPVYSPALVAFFGGPIISVGIGLPLVSWVPLAWGEPLVPWWGPVGFIGQPCWWGWGGPHIVNNIVINTGDVVNANSINLYRNASVPGGVVAVNKDEFAARAIDRVRVSGVSATDLKPVHGPLPVVSRTAGATAAAGGKVPVPALGPARPATDAVRDFGRNPPRSLGPAERAGAPPLTGTKTASSAFDRVRGAPGAPGGRAALARTGTAADFARQAPSSGTAATGKPPLPNAAFDAARGAPAQGASIDRAGRGRDVSRGQPATRGAKPNASGSFARLRTQPPPLHQYSPGTRPNVQRTGPGTGSTVPPPRSFSRSAIPSGGSAARPAVPGMRTYEGPSGGGGAPAYGSLGRDYGGTASGGMVGGPKIGASPSIGLPPGGSPGGFSRGGGGGIPNLGRSTGSGGGGGSMGGGKLGR